MQSIPFLRPKQNPCPSDLIPRPVISLLPPIPDDSGFAGAFAGVHGHHLLAGGGANFPDGIMPWDGGKKVWHDRVYSLDLSQPGAGWMPAGMLPCRNGYGVSLSCEEGVLIIGGGNETRHFDEVHLMALNGGGKVSFRPLPQMPLPLAQMTGAMVGRIIHVLGGITRPDAAEASAVHLTLDLDAAFPAWLAAPPLPGAGRMLATSAAVGNEFIVAGGCGLCAGPDGKAARTYLTDAWKFSGGAWIRLADLPRPAVAAASPAPASAGSFYVVSGDDGTQAELASPRDHRGFTSQILRYELKEDRWVENGHLDTQAVVTLPTAPWEDGTIFFNGELKPGLRSPGVFIFKHAS